jgi:hypothetical protein
MAGPFFGYNLTNKDYTFYSETLKEKQLDRPRSRWEDNVTVDLKSGRENVE